MKILTLNTNNASPNAQGGTGAQTAVSTIKELSNNGNEGNGNAGNNSIAGCNNSSNHKNNKREQKHNSKTKFIHGNNNNKMQQQLTQQQQQQQQQKYNSSGGGGNKLKKQHYNNSTNNNNNNSTSSLNRKKYYQQQQQQQQHYQQQQQQQQYLTALQHNNHTTPATSNTPTTVTNNNNSNLVKNQNYTNIDLLIQQQQQQQHNIHLNQTKTNSLESCTCLLQQTNCDKLSISNCSSASSSSCSSSSSSSATTTATSLANLHTTTAAAAGATATITGDYHRQHHQQLHTICYENHLKTAQTKSPSSTSACISCWTNFNNKLPQQPLKQTASIVAATNIKSTSTNLQEFVASAVAAAAAVANKCNSNQNLCRTTSSSSSSSLSTSSTTASNNIQLTSNLTSSSSSSPSTSSSTSKKKSFWKNSNANNNSSGQSGIVNGSNLSNSNFTSTQSPKLAKEKLHNSDKNLITNTGVNSGSASRQSLGKTGGNNNVNHQKYSTTLATNTPNSSQTKQISKHQVQAIVDKIAMTTSLTSVASSGSSSSSSIKSLATANSSNNTNASTTISKTSPKQKQHQKDTLETKQMLKSFTTNKNSDTIKSSISTTTSTSLTSTATSVPSSPNSYTLDFLHSVGVKMSGVAIRSTSAVQGSTNNYGNQTSNNSPVHSSYPYAGVSTNQRQTRYMYGNSNNNGGGSVGSNNQQQQQHHHHHHHHQPPQLTIASFLQKDLLGGDNILSNGNSSNSGNNGGGANSSNTRNTNNNYNEQHYSQQQQRYHHNYYPTPYQQQTTGSQHSTNYGGVGFGSGELARLVTNGGGGGNSQRNSGYAYTNYHNTNTANEIGMGKNNSISSHQQQQSRQNTNLSNYTNSSNSNNSQGNKKSSYASSTTSTCSSSSTKSISSNSSNTSSGRQMQQQTNVTVQDSNNAASSLNLAIETLPSKSLGVGNQRGNHRGHHHSHHGHHHHNHHGHHHHHQHSMMNSPNLLQHQNYYNLTYVSTDGSVNGAGGGSTSRGCSPAPQSLPPTPLSNSNCHSPKPLESSPGPVAMLMNFNASHLHYGRYGPNAQPQMVVQQQQHFHQFQQQQQQQNFLNKKMLAPLTLAMPSPSPSPTPPSNNVTSLALNTHQAPPPQPHNIICCSQLDEATTAAAAAAASSTSSVSGIIAGNDYDSDTSSNHSSAQHKYHSLKSLKSSLSSSSTASSASASNASLSLSGQQQTQSQICSQPSTPAACGPSTPLLSPLDYNYGGIPNTSQAFPNLQVAQQLTTPQHTYKPGNDTNNQHLPHIYANNGSAVISLLNLPTKSPNSYTEDDYHPHVPQQFYFNTPANQPSVNDHLNIASALTAVANRSNSNNGYWSPSPHNNQFLYQQNNTTQVTLMPASVTTSSSSCGSSSASISPRLPNDELAHGQQQIQHNCCLTSNNSTSPSPCTSCLNEQFSNLIIGSNTNLDSGGGNNVGNGVISTNSTNGGGQHNFKRGSSQLLVQQQQRLIAQHPTYPQSSSSSSTSSVSSSSASTLTSAIRARGGVGVGGSGISANNVRNNHISLAAPPPNSVGCVSNSGIMAGPQQLPPPPQPTQQQLYSHHQHQQQSLPPPIPPHNLLYNNPQSHHMRALNNSSINSSVHDFFTHTPPDRFLARAHLVEAKEAPATLLNNSKWDHLSQDIWKKFIHSQQTEETFKQKMRLWRYLYLFIKNAYPRYGLYLVGSTISGFGSDSSDVDMCLVSRSASSIDARMEALFNLTVLRDCLSKSGEFENFNLIEAKVPILRFRDRIHQLEVDLNFNNCVGIKNTHLLYCYSQLDWRLRPLVLVTKLWAQYHNINNAKNMTISSYSLVLMVIHFLQYAVNPPVLPCLHEIFPYKFPLLRSNDIGYVDMNETIGPYESKNTQTIGELFLYFLEYYSCFDYAQFAISIRTGGLLPINVCRTAKSIKNDIHQWKELCIEEPFDLTNTARSVYDSETFERVKAVFVASWRTLQETLDLNSVFSPLLITSPCSSTGSSMCLVTNTNATSTTTFSEIESDVTITDTKDNIQQYLDKNLIKNFNDATTTTTTTNVANENYEDSNYSSNDEKEKYNQEHDNDNNYDDDDDEDDDIIIDVNGDDDDNNDNNVFDNDNNIMSSSTVNPSREQKLSKHIDLNRTLTPCQLKIYEENKKLPSPTTSPSTNTTSMTCIKANTKIINSNSKTTSTNLLTS
ncbi:uncharacterized protein ACRADG_006689 isoform 2-T4 [Cochliomyia hominivorax]